MAVQAKLNSRQRRFLLDQGYLVVRSQLDPAVLARVKGRLDGLVRQTVAAWADDPSLDTTEACVVAEFDVADPGFVPCHQHRLLADAANLVLGDPWHVRGLDLRAPIPGAGEQGVHPDYAERRTEGPWQTLSAMWCITPFTRDSGPLRLIPGSRVFDTRPAACDRADIVSGPRHGCHAARARCRPPAEHESRPGAAGCHSVLPG